MKKFAHSAALLALCAAPLLASIDGTVVNGSSGKPEPGVHITLLKPGAQGMQALGTTTSGADGRFVFEHDQPGGGPQLLQASYQGVNYNKLLTPNVPTSNVQLDIYDVTRSAAGTRVAEHMLVLEPSSSQLGVNETAVIENPGKATYNNDAAGAFRFYVPPEAAGHVSANAQGPQGMPLPQAVLKTPEANVFKVNFPIKPGETQIQIAYAMPAQSAAAFEGRAENVPGMTAAPLRLIAPRGVTLSGADIASIGTEPRTQATIYNVTTARKFRVAVTGSGSLRGADTPATDESDSPPLREGAPQIYSHLGWLAALALSIMALALVTIYRGSPVRR